MAEAHQARVQSVIEDMVQNLERDHIRKMQVSGHSIQLCQITIVFLFNLRMELSVLM